MNQTLLSNISGTFLFFLVCLFLGASYLSYERSLCETLEAESAIIARAYATGQARLINQLDGKEDLDKPPLYYWVIAGFSFFAPNWEMAARLPSLLSLAIFVLLFFAISASMGRTGPFFFLWSVMFLFCPKILWMGQIARMDMLFSATCFLGLFFFMKGAGLLNVENDDEGSTIIEGRYLAGLFISAAASVMMKGPLGAILIFVPIILFILTEKRFVLLKRAFLSPYFLLFLALCLPWYAYVTVKTDFRFFHRFILEENLSRFTSLLPGGGFKEFNHSPSTRYLVYFLTGFFPWSLMALFWIPAFFRKWKALRPVTRFFLLDFAFVFIFFSMAVSKRSDYILPLYPAAAFLGAEYVFFCGKPFTFSRLVRFVIVLVMAICGLLALVGVLSHFGDVSAIFSYAFHVKNPALIQFLVAILKRQTLLFLFLALCSLLVLVFGMRRIPEGRPATALASFNILAGVLICCLMLFTLPAIYKGKDARPFCSKVKEIVGEKPLFYGGFWDEECSFYLKRKVTRIDISKVEDLFKDRDKQVFFILDGKRYRLLEKRGLRFPLEYRDKGLVLRTLVLVWNLNKT